MKMDNANNFLNSLNSISYFTEFFLSRPVSKCIISTVRFAYFAKDKYFMCLYQADKRQLNSGNDKISEVKIPPVERVIEAKKALISSVLRIGIVALSAIVATGIVLCAIQLAITLNPIVGIATGMSGISALLIGIYCLDPESLLNILDFSLTVGTYLSIVFGGIPQFFTAFLSHLSFYLINIGIKEEIPNGFGEGFETVEFFARLIKSKCNQDSQIDRLSIKISEFFL